MEFLSHFPHPRRMPHAHSDVDSGVLLLRSENSKRLMRVIAPRRGFLLGCFFTMSIKGGLGYNR